MDIKIPIGIPEHYIPQASLRLALYRRLLRDLNFEDIEEINREIVDRFGSSPEEIELLLNITN